MIHGMEMTYHEDVASVKDSFKKMLDSGIYKLICLVIFNDDKIYRIII